MVHTAHSLVTGTGFKSVSKMPTVRNASSLVTSRELPSGLQIWGKSLLNALFSVGNIERGHRQRV